MLSSKNERHRTFRSESHTAATAEGISIGNSESGEVRRKIARFHVVVIRQEEVAAICGQQPAEFRACMCEDVGKRGDNQFTAFNAFDNSSRCRLHAKSTPLEVLSYLA